MHGHHLPPTPPPLAAASGAAAGPSSAPAPSPSSLGPTRDSLRGLRVRTLSGPMIFLFLNGVILIVLLRLIFVSNEIHQDLLSNHSCLKYFKIKYFGYISSHYHYLWIGSRLVTLEHSKLGPGSSLSHKLGNHLPLYLVGYDHLDLLAILVEHVLSDDLGVSLHLLGWWRQGGAVPLLYLISPVTSNWF